MGCVGCPMAGKGRYREFAQYPKYRQMYINAFDRMIAALALRGEMAGRWGMGTTGVDVFHWWMEDGVLPGQFEIEEDEL